MINILQHGQDFYQATCDWCGCKFEFQDSDCHHFSSDYSQYVEVYCPQCKIGLRGYNCKDIQSRYIDKKE